MQLTDLREVIRAQQEQVAKQTAELSRDMLPDLPDIQTYALIITGIRRCGKSTLLRQFARKLRGKYFYLNFDDLRLADFTARDFPLLDSLILESGVKTLLLDEIQMAPRWEAYARQKLDEGFQVLLTGSNAALLSRELGTKLTGRHITKELFPFSYQEFLRFTKRGAGVKSLDQYLRVGGFPEYLKTKRPEVLNQLQQDILYRDIAVRYGLRDVASLKRLFVYLVSNAAHLVSPSKLTGVIGLRSHTTVLEYLSYFEEAYLLQLVPRFAWSVKKQNLAPKKLYVGDAGLLRSVSVSFTPDRGGLLENFVFNELRRRTRDIFYFADKTGECDFIVDPHGGNPLCAQVCLELTLDNRDREINGLLAALDFFKSKRGVIITRDTRDVIVRADRRIEVLPAWDKRLSALCDQDNKRR
ncbi:MAG: ATP-binding protein [Candidatus Margulisbacteria bacterium]|jgi:predicted AAA+ superfamily ATPase|nr:ATP-binding protein [Candidatus Margulisiibacteriota bacterium]